MGAELEKVVKSSMIHAESLAPGTKSPFVAVECEQLNARDDVVEAALRHVPTRASRSI